MKQSFTEKKISKILNTLGIQYITEASFNDCRHIRLLRFDFYIPKLNLCIEYDGKHHFRPKKRNMKEYIEQRKRDNIKFKWCIKNRVSLIRIPYWRKKHIKNILIYWINMNKRVYMTYSSKCFAKIL